MHGGCSQAVVQRHDVGADARTGACFAGGGHAECVSDDVSGSWTSASTHHRARVNSVRGWVSTTAASPSADACLCALCSRFGSAVQGSSLPVAMVVQVAATANAAVGGGSVLQSLDGAVVFDRLTVTAPPGSLRGGGRGATNLLAWV